MVMWCSPHMEQSLDEQCGEWLGTSEFSPISCESTGVESKIQPCLKPNFLKVLPASVPIKLASETDADHLAEDRGPSRRARIVDWRATAETKEAFPST